MRWRGCIGFILLISFGWSLEGMAFEIVSPKEGVELEIGGKHLIQIKPESGEEKWSMKMINDFDDMSPLTFNPATGMFEGFLNLSRVAEIMPGPAKLRFLGVDTFEGLEMDEAGEPKKVPQEIKLTHKVQFVLPSTTVLTGISAEIGSGKKQDFLTLFERTNGKLVQTRSSYTMIRVAGLYSDGVRRVITEHPDTTYISNDETVVKVISPGKTFGDEIAPPRGQVIVPDVANTITGPSGSALTLMPDSFSAPIEVKIDQDRTEEPTSIPSGINAVGDLFHIKIAEASPPASSTTEDRSVRLSQPAEFSIPAPRRIAPNTPLFLLKKRVLKDGRLVWVVVDVAKVVGQTETDNGRVTTASPPFPGLMDSGEMTSREIREMVVDDQHWGGALVTAVGPGRAKIIVRHGPYEDSVTGIVNVEPCNEWKKTRSSKTAFPVCD